MEGQMGLVPQNTLGQIFQILYFQFGHTDAAAGEDTDIRTLWNPATGKFVIGFYNLKMAAVDNNEVNVEVILDTNNGEIKFVYGDFTEFQKLDSK